MYLIKIDPRNYTPLSFRFVSSLLCILVSVSTLVGLTGCSDNFKLVVCHEDGNWGTDDPWTVLDTPHPPLGAREEAVCKAAMSKRSVTTDCVSAIPLVHGNKYAQVLAVEDFKPAKDPMRPKRITSYLVTMGKIAAVSSSVLEPSPDEDYERTLFKAARGASLESDAAVIIYSRPDRNLTVSGTANGKCSMKVKVIDGFNSAGDTLSTRFINVCGGEDI